MVTLRLRITLAIFLSVLLTVTVAGAHPFGHKKGIEGSGDLETRDFDLADFDEISVGGAFEVDVTFGDRQSVAVTIDDNLWDNLELMVKGGRLVVDWDDSCSPDDDCRIVLVVQELKAMSVSGASAARIERFAGEKFKFNLSGAASLEMDGAADELEIQVSGAGDIDTRDLSARHVKVRISGAGNADLTATESLDAKVSGVGNINYWGNPEEKKTSISGMGSINSR